MNIEKYTKFPKNQYFQEVFPKKIFQLHHTASGAGEKGDIQWWEKTPERVGAAYIITRDGKIVEIFDPKYWIHSLGVTVSGLRKYGSSVTNIRLNQLGVAIEIDSWGILTKKDGKFYSYTNQEVDAKNVIEYPTPFRGSKYYERYTDAQIAALEFLIRKLNKDMGIPMTYFPEMWETNAKALKGYHGIWTHVSYREDKSDCHPQPELIKMLQSL